MWSKLSAAALCVGAGLAMTAPAQAHGLSIGIGIGVPVAPPVYVAPPPVAYPAVPVYRPPRYVNPYAVPVAPAVVYPGGVVVEREWGHRSRHVHYGW